MSIWFFIVVVIGVLYALNRLTTTTDLPVSARLARARALIERGRRRARATSRSSGAGRVIAREPQEDQPRHPHGS